MPAKQVGSGDGHLVVDADESHVAVGVWVAFECDHAVTDDRDGLAGTGA
jgi:hypothetical protein